VINPKYYLKFYSIGLRNSLEYKMVVISGILNPIIGTIVFTFIWAAIYNLGYTTIGSFTLNEMIFYYLTGMIIGMFYVDMAGYFQEEVMSGHLLQHTIRNINPFLRRYFSFLGFQTFWIITTILIVIIFSVFVSLPVTLLGIILFIPFLIIAVALRTVISSLIALLTVKTQRIMSIMQAFNTLNGFLAGMWLPLTFFPPAYQSVFYYLPFQYMYFFPNMVLAGKITSTQMLIGFLFAMIWLVFFIIIFGPLYKKAIKYFEAQGG